MDKNQPNVQNALHIFYEGIESLPKKSFHQTILIELNKILILPVYY